MDVISDILQMLKFKGCLYFTTRFYKPWGIQVPAYGNVARFHMAMGGTCWFQVDGVTQPCMLNPGEMIVIPHGAAHTMSDALDSPITQLDVVTQGFEADGPLHFGEGPESARLVCGHFEYDPLLEHPLLKKLPPLILVQEAQAREFSWFDQALKLMAFEAEGGRPGNAAIVEKLTEILFIHVVRVWQQSTQTETGFMTALSDQALDRSLTALHNKISHKWSLAELAKEAGLSRTIFAERFRSLMGITPMQYLTDWRMQCAKRLLIDSREPVELIAESVGYESPAAFSRAFKKIIGLGPGGFRKRQASSSGSE